LLRTTLEEGRDNVTLAAEWAFVERYLEIERLRFDARLQVQVDLTDAARAALLPAFALQTLVENAVRHGVAPRVEPTRVTVTGVMTGSMLHLTVRDEGPGVDLEAVAAGAGTGLVRLRERLAALYAGRARLELESQLGNGFTARLSVPQAPGHAAAAAEAAR
jgi:LytS/YehU family sensor histidine kinase